MNLEGLIPILGGIYFALLVYGTIPKNPKNPEKMAEWRKRYGPFIKVLVPIVILYGVLQLAGVL